MKKFFITLMCIVMVVCFMPTVALADTNVAFIDKDGNGIKDDVESGYSTLQDAVNNAEANDTVFLLMDTTLTSAITINKSITLNLNGKKIDGNNVSGSAEGLIIASGENVTLNIVGAGSVNSAYNVGSRVLSSVCATDGATINIGEEDNPTVYAEFGQNNIAVYAYQDGTVNIYSGSFKATGGGTCTAALGKESNKTAIVNIYGGTFVGADEGTGCAWANNQNAIIKIYNGNFSAVPLGKVSVEGETEGANYLLYDYRDANQSVWPHGYVTVYGGTFIDFNPAQNYAGTNFVADGYITTSQADAWVVGESLKVAAIGDKKYETLKDAVENVPEGIETTIKMLHDTVINTPEDNRGVNAIQIPAGKKITLDLNGFTITKTGPHGDWGEVQTSCILNRGTLIIKDTSSDKTGTIIGGGYHYCQGGVLKNYGILNVEGGTFKGGAGTNGMDMSGHYVIYNIGEVNISGGYFWNNSTGTALIRNDNVMNITGGIFEQESFLVLRNADAKAKMNSSGDVVVKETSDRAIQNYGTVSINGGLFGGKVQCASRNDAASSTIIAGGTFNGEVYATKGHDDNFVGTEAVSNITISSGTFSSDVSDYVADNCYEYAMRNGTYIVKASGAEKPAFTTGNYWSDLVGKVYTEMYSAPYIPSTPTTPTDNVTNSGTAGTDNATTSADLSGSTTTSNDTTATAVDKTTADKIVDKAVENKSTEVVIDATANTTTAANSTTVAQVTIPTETLGAIAEKTEADVTIKTDVAEVKMDNAAAAAVSEQATGDTVQIVAEKVKEDAAEVHFELKVVCSNGTVISDFKGGNVAVTVTLPKEMADKKVVCVYIDDNGHMSKVEGQKNADGTYTFVTGHFSTYAIMAEEEADAAIAVQTEAIKNIKIKLTSKQIKTKSGKKAVKVTWTAAAGDKVLDGVEVFRSKEKNKGYGTKAFFTSTKGGNKGSYINTKGLKKGTRYYYKVRGYVLVNGEKVYTDYSTKAWRTVK